LENPLLNIEIQQFIDANIGVDIAKLALAKNPFSDVIWTEILNQITVKTKIKDKLPTFFTTPNILYPSKISSEQTSSELAAIYKSELISGEILIDLTGGFGVDTYFFSKKIKHVIHCEIDSELSQIVAHNFKVLNAKNVEFHQGDSFEILKSLNRKIDVIYIDPSRRNASKGKVFMLKDCLPNVPELLDFYFNYSNSILIKTAPILDISAGLLELKNVKCIHVVAVNNEVKELLWEIEKSYSGVTRIKTVNLLKEKKISFEFDLNNSGIATYSLPQKYLYEPNGAIMKSGGFDEISAFYQLPKLHSHSHLYTSETCIEFPGRIFEIKSSFSYTKTNMKQYLEGKKANLTIRNFPDTVEIIRKKWKIKEGGESYCFFTTDLNNDKIVLICNKIS
jgi:hypothetical protein